MEEQLDKHYLVSDEESQVPPISPLFFYQHSKRFVHFDYAFLTIYISKLIKLFSIDKKMKLLTT